MKNFNLQARRGAVALIAFLTVIVVLGTGQAAAQSANIEPFIICVERERDSSGAATGNYITYFGYSNPNAANSILPYNGPNNFFTPVEPPTGISVFLPGVHPQVISITAPLSTNVTWFLGITPVTASFNGTNLCAADGANSRLMTYQGKLSDGATAANGVYDLQFQLFNQLTGGTARTSVITLDNVPVTNGIFTVQLDLGAAVLPTENAVISPAKLNPAILDAENSFFEIGVRPGTSTGAYTTLTPRQPLTAVPLAMRANTANNAFRAANADNFGGLSPKNYLKNTNPYGAVSFTVDSGTVNGDLNVSGVSAANSFEATTQYNIGGNRVLSNGGTRNLFAGADAGSANTSGSSNAFFGSGAGAINTTGSNNAFFGTQTGQSNTSGFSNAFFGTFAGIGNATGDNNAFFGTEAGAQNTTGRSNSFFGSGAGRSNLEGNFNSFFAVGAGYSNTSGYGNAFVGFNAGTFNTTGYGNVFVGQDAGRTNTTGNRITLLGYNASVGADNLSFAAAIGAGTTVSTSNTVVLGRAADSVQIPGTLNVAGNTGITGTTDRVLNLQGSSNIGTWLTLDNTTTGGRRWSVISTDANNGEGAGKLLFYDLTNGAGRLLLSSDGASVNGNLTVSGTISGNVSSSCRSGFTAVSNGRLCISAMQPPATYINSADTCTSMGARIGNSADVALSFTLSGFNYFAGSTGGEPTPKGWLADIINDNVRATWNVNNPAQDFDGTPLNIATGGTGGTAPQLLYRCVY